MGGVRVIAVSLMGDRVRVRVRVITVSLMGGQG